MKCRNSEGLILNDNFSGKRPVRIDMFNAYLQTKIKVGYYSRFHYAIMQTVSLS